MSASKCRKCGRAFPTRPDPGITEKKGVALPPDVCAVDSLPCVGEEGSMMDDEKVDSAARRIFAWLRPDGFPNWAGLSEETRGFYRRVADDALSVVREEVA